MPSWDDLLNCVCQNGAGSQRPGIQEVLDTLQRSTVCTGTQCFETEADAFGLQAPPNGEQGTPSAFFITMAMMMLAAMYLKMRKPTPQITEGKPGSSSDHANEPPTPPPPTA